MPNSIRTEILIKLHHVVSNNGLSKSNQSTTIELRKLQKAYCSWLLLLLLGLGCDLE